MTTQFPLRMARIQPPTNSREQPQLYSAHPSHSVSVLPNQDFQALILQKEAQDLVAEKNYRRQDDKSGAIIE